MSNKLKDRQTQKGSAKEEPDNNAHIESLSDVFEKLGKIVAVGLVVCYGMGMLITNLYLSNVIGTSDLEAIRAKFIFTGFIYLIYLLIPIALFCLPFICWQYLFIRLKSTTFWRVLLVTLFTIIVASCLVIIVPIMLHYFIPFIKFSFPGDGNSACAVLDFVSTCVIIFWRFYFSHSILGSILVSLVICAYYYELGRKERVSFRGKLKKTLMIAIAFNILFQIFFFWENVYANIDDSIGGGNPRTVMIRLKQGQLLPAGSQYYSNCGDGIMLPALLFYMGKEFAYIMPVAENNSNKKCLNIVAIRTDAIEGFSRLNGCVRCVRSRSSSTVEVYYRKDEGNIWIVKPSMEIGLYTTNGIANMGITKTHLECSIVTTNSTLLIADAKDALMITHPNGYSTIKTDLAIISETLHNFSVSELVKEQIGFRLIFSDGTIKEVSNVSFNLWVNGTTCINYSLKECKKDQFGAYWSINFSRNASNQISRADLSWVSISNSTNVWTTKAGSVQNTSTNKIIGKQQE